MNAPENPPDAPLAPSVESPEHALLTVSETMRELRCSRAKLYHLMATGALPYVVIGSRRLVTAGQLRAYIASQTRSPEPGARGPGRPPGVVPDPARTRASARGPAPEAAC